MRSSNETPGTPSSTMCPATPTNRNHHPGPPRQHEGTKAARAVNQCTEPVQPSLPLPLERSGECPPLKLEQPGPSHRRQRSPSSTKATPATRRPECEGEETLTHQMPTKTIRETDINDAYYPKAPTTTFQAQKPTAQLGGGAPQHWGLHPDQDVFEDTPGIDEKQEAHEQAQNDSGELSGTTQPRDEEPDWSRDSPDASEEETENDTSSQRTPDLTCSSWGATRPAEPEGPPPPGARLRGETRKERNRRDREEWRQRRRIRRRLGLEPGYF